MGSMHAIITLHLPVRDQAPVFHRSTGKVGYGNEIHLVQRVRCSKVVGVEWQSPHSELEERRSHYATYIHEHASSYTSKIP